MCGLDVVPRRCGRHALIWSGHLSLTCESAGITMLEGKHTIGTSQLASVWGKNYSVFVICGVLNMYRI